MFKFFNPTYAKTGTEKEILKFLQQHDTAAIATYSAKGEPHVSSVTYACEDNFDIYLVMKENSIKFRNILALPKVGLAIGDSAASLRMANIHAQAEVIEDPHHFIIDYFANVRNPLEPMILPQGEDVYVKLHIIWLRWLDLDISGESKSREFQHIFPVPIDQMKKVDRRKKPIHA